MTLQTLKLGREEFVVIARRDFDRLAAEASLQREDDYWAEAALAAEAKAKSRKETPISFEQIEREIDARRKSPAKTRRRR